MRTPGNAVLLSTALLLGTVAHAKHGLHAEANLAQLTYKADGLPSARPSSFGLKLGSQINFNLAVEARFGVGVAGDTVSSQGTSRKVDVDHHYGVYTKGLWPVSKVFAAYGLIGYTRGKVTSRVLGARASQSDSDFSYGVGAEWELSRAISLTAEWARLFRGADYQVDGLALGVVKRF